MRPPMKLPSEIERKYTPSIMLTMRGGASLLTVESPTGERHSSPIVWQR
jgi:hypothetical protein